MGYVLDSKTQSAGSVSGVAGDTNKYDVSKLQYPIDLDTSNEYGGHKVLFFINIPGNSAIATGKARQAAVADGADSADIEYGMGSVDLPPNKYAKKAGTRVKELAGKFGIKADITKQHKRLTAAISLYVPNNLQTGWSVDWSPDDMRDLALFDALAGGASKIASDNVMKADTGSTTETLVSAGIAKKFAAGDLQYVQKALGVTYGNSKAEQLFKSVDFRTFQFNFDFAPKSEAESENALRIIRMFRHHMLPEYLDTENFLYIYPSEFDVKYYRNDKENEYLEKQMTAVLTNLSVNYTPNGQFTTFDNGMPTHISINMTFRELAVPTKETSPYWKSGI